MLDLLLHPLRMRIVQSLIGGRQLNAGQISARLADVAPASLYRHLSSLVQGGVLQVVKENRIRGTIERIYAIKDSMAEDANNEALAMSREELLRHFFSFQLNLLGDMERYLARDKIDLVKDGLGYRQASLYLSDAEFNALMEKMGTLIMSASENEPAPGRTLRSLATIVLPTE